jgi:hypothetical protein
VGTIPRFPWVAGRFATEEKFNQWKEDMRSESMRKFDTGATRDDEDEKLDPEGFISPLVLQSFAEYMHKHRMQADGKLRASDNWQKGISQDVYMKSLWRHFLDLWHLIRGYERFDQKDGHTINLLESCNAMLFNIMGLMFEDLNGRTPDPDPLPLPIEFRREGRRFDLPDLPDLPGLEPESPFYYGERSAYPYDPKVGVGKE